MGESAELLSFSAGYVSRYFLALVRVLGAVSLNPLLGSARVPVPARIGLGLFATMVLFPPGAPDAEPAEVGPLEIAGELLVGLLAGFAVTLIFGAVHFAAGVIGVNSGFSFAGTINPMFEHGGGAIESFFSAFALMLFVQTNGHHLFLAGLRDLFELVEVGGVTRLPGTVETLTQMSAGLFVAGLKMALPVLAALLLADLGVAILAKVAPQLNLFALELPLKMALGVVAVAVALPVIAPRLTALFRAVPAGMAGLVG